MILCMKNIRIWAFPAPVDLRKGFNGLSGLVANFLVREVMGGDLFLFVNKRRKAAKLLYWDGNGLCILHKRLASGKTFPRLWRRKGGSSVGGIPLSPQELSLFLDGCKLVEQNVLSPQDHSLKLLAS